MIQRCRRNPKLYINAITFVPVLESQEPEIGDVRPSLIHTV